MRLGLQEKMEGSSEMEETGMPKRNWEAYLSGRPSSRLRQFFFFHGAPSARLRAHYFTAEQGRRVV